MIYDEINTFCKVFNLDKKELINNFQKSHFKELVEEYESNIEN